MLPGPIDPEAPELGTFFPDPAVAGLPLPTTSIDAARSQPFALPDLGSAAARAYDEALRVAQRVDRSLENLERCLAVTSEGRPGCDRFLLFQDSICVGTAVAKQRFFGRLGKVFDLLFDLENPYCREEGLAADAASLICCKPFLTTTACTSDTACAPPPDEIRSFGPCLDLPNVGCDCEYLPDCELGGVEPPAPIGQAHYAHVWFETLHRAFRDLWPRSSTTLDGSPTLTDLLRFSTFHGCRNRLEILTEADPFAGVDEILSSQLPPDADFRILDLAAQNAALRVMAALPNGPYRYAYVASRRWTPERRAAHFQASGFTGEPERELSRHLGPIGLYLLGQTLGRDDRALLAVPAPGEPPGDSEAEAEAEDGCELALAPVIESLVASVDGAEVTVSTVVRDPEAPAGGGGVLAVEWADGRIDTHGFYTAGEVAVMRHVYARTGRFPIAVTATNRAGLSDSAWTGATIDTGSCLMVTPSTLQVVLEGEARRVGGGGDGPSLGFEVTAIAPNGRSTPLGRELVGRLVGRRDLGRVAFDHPALDPVAALEIRMRRLRGLGGGRLHLAAITLVNRRPGLEGTTEVRVPAGAIDASGGRFSRLSGALVLRSDEVYRLTLPGFAEVARICPQGSGAVQ